MALRIVLSIFAAVLIVALVYAAYFLISYHRVPDNISLDVHRTFASPSQVDKQYSILSWNIGFGAYEADYDFFMDGGKQSWAPSKKGLLENMDKISALLADQKADLYMIQEVDVDGTRSYHVDESAYLAKALDGYSYSFAENWDCPFIIIPLDHPHGANYAGIMTFSSFGMTEALRKSLPVEDSIMKLVDLDRCYSISRIPVEGGKELVLINFHLSAYTSDGKIAIEQLKMVIADMQAEYEAGNWCIAGGDFNKDLIGTGSQAFGVEGSEYNWAQPIPASTFEGTVVSLVSPHDASNPIPSARNADAPYWPGQYQVTIDGFMVTPNVQVVESHVLDTGFAYSDHNPVSMSFILK
ncbi:MAG: endonuclease/exonuclease/phosphatase family protein [Sphaerochaetaceae bacterium]|nr:endonuclease/exonuclease/phosphatase family protein [Sphaerochaetaceae bacterium]